MFCNFDFESTGLAISTSSVPHALPRGRAAADVHLLGLGCDEKNTLSPKPRRP